MSEADGTKLLRQKSAPAALRGGRPIRKRGFHRALKRGDLWAKLQTLYHDCQVQVMNSLLYAPNPFLDLVKPKK